MSSHFGLGDALSLMSFALNWIRNSSDHSDRLGYQLWHRPFTKGKLATPTKDNQGNFLPIDQQHYSVKTIKVIIKIMASIARSLSRSRFKTRPWRKARTSSKTTAGEANSARLD